MPSSFILSLAATLAASLVAADTLAVVVPCNECQNPPPAITVTEIYQPVSTCSPVPSCNNGVCTTTYSYSTFPWVSTVIPCAGPTPTTTVTCVEQPITVSVVTSTVTSTVSCTSSPATSTVYTTYVKEWVAPYQALGPMAMSGYGGSGLCTACEANEAGMMTQIYNVTECWTCGNDISCVGYPEVVVQSPSPSVTATVTATCSSTAMITAAGTYTYSFLQTCPATTITAASQTTVCPAQTYYAVYTTACAGAGVIEIKATITQQVSYNYGIQTGAMNEWLALFGASLESWFSQSPPATPSGWNNWSPAPPSANAAGWSNWNAGAWNNWQPTTTGSMTRALPPTSTATVVQGPFVITVQDQNTPGARFAKRQIYGYIQFVGGTAQVTTSRSSASNFYLDSNGNLLSNGLYIGTTSTSSQFLGESLTIPAGSNLWSLSNTNGLTLGGTLGLCLLGNNIEVTYASQPPPPLCLPLALIAGGSLPTTSSTTTTTSAVAITTSTTSAIPSNTACASVPPFVIMVETGPLALLGQELVLNEPSPADQGEMTFSTNSQLTFSVSPNCNILSYDGYPLEMKMITAVGEKALYDGGSNGTPMSCTLNPENSVISCGGSTQFWAYSMTPTGPLLLYSTQTSPSTSGAKSITLAAAELEDC